MKTVSDFISVQCLYLPGLKNKKGTLYTITDVTSASMQHYEGNRIIPTSFYA